jgi:hypothetical protein
MRLSLVLVTALLLASPATLQGKSRRRSPGRRNPYESPGKAERAALAPE